MNVVKNKANQKEEKDFMGKLNLLVQVFKGDEQAIIRTAADTNQFFILSFFFRVCMNKEKVPSIVLHYPEFIKHVPDESDSNRLLMSSGLDSLKEFFLKCKSVVPVPITYCLVVISRFMQSMKGEDNFEKYVEAEELMKAINACLAENKEIEVLFSYIYFCELEGRQVKQLLLEAMFKKIHDFFSYGSQEHFNKFEVFIVSQLTSLKQALECCSQKGEDSENKRLLDKVYVLVGKNVIKHIGVVDGINFYFDMKCEVGINLFINSMVKALKTEDRTEYLFELGELNREILVNYPELEALSLINSQNEKGLDKIVKLVFLRKEEGIRLAPIFLDCLVEWSKLNTSLKEEEITKAISFLTVYGDDIVNDATELTTLEEFLSRKDKLTAKIEGVKQELFDKLCY